MEYEGDMGGSDFGNMGNNMHFNNGNMGHSNFTFNGSDMNGMGVDPSQIFSMFFNQGGEQFSGFPNSGGRKPAGNTRGSSRPNGFPGFDAFGGFKKGSNFA
jgi:hypothetical protein